MKERGKTTTEGSSTYQRPRYQEPSDFKNYYSTSQPSPYRMVDRHDLFNDEEGALEEEEEAKVDEMMRNHAASRSLNNNNQSIQDSKTAREDFSRDHSPLPTLREELSYAKEKRLLSSASKSPVKSRIDRMATVKDRLLTSSILDSSYQQPNTQHSRNRNSASHRQEQHGMTATKEKQEMESILLTNQIRSELARSKDTNNNKKNSNSGKQPASRATVSQSNTIEDASKELTRTESESSSEDNNFKIMPQTSRQAEMLSRSNNNSYSLRRQLQNDKNYMPESQLKDLDEDEEEEEDKVIKSTVKNENRRSSVAGNTKNSKTRIGDLLKSKEGKEDDDEEDSDAEYFQMMSSRNNNTVNSKPNSSAIHESHSRKPSVFQRSKKEKLSLKDLL
jgi:hypothetical protein